jgi:hypothetical protein
MIPVRLRVAMVALAAGLLSARSATAGPVWDWLTHAECPSPSYSPVRYWAPAIAHLNDDIHGPKISVYAVNMHPETPITYDILKFKRKCPAPDPAATLIEVPLPPPTSKAR